MIAGDARAWKDRFLTLDERLLRRIVQLWPTCTALLPGQPEEDTITINLVNLLSNDAVVRQLCYFVVYQHEPFGTNPGGAKYSKGKIDIAFLLDWERERYLAYECKRLNVVHNGARSSLATPYVKEGMMRFMTEQYAEGLPVGCMLGYVMDGDFAFALAQLNSAIVTNKGPLGSIGGATPAQTVIGIERFATLHHRASQSLIELRHALLPFCAKQGALSQTTAMKAALFSQG